MIKTEYTLESSNGSLWVTIKKDPLSDEGSGVTVYMSVNDEDPRSAFNKITFNLEEFKSFIDTIWSGI